MTDSAAADPAFTSHTAQSEHRAHQAMGPGREFDTIRMLMERWGDLAVDIGDDAAVLPPNNGLARVISTDACVEGTHFLREWLSPFEVGVRAAAAALSDLAAMGASADAVLLAFSVPDDWRPRLGFVADGIADVVRASGARIVGGNLSRADALSITTTVVGSAEQVISRRGAQPGDVVLVTGTLGGPGAATRAWYAGEQPSAWARGRFVAPQPRLAEGRALAAAGAHAMLDISDGLASDARHLAAASHVAITIDASRLPCGDGVSPRDALAGGEEYELLVAMPPETAARVAESWSTQFPIPLTVIGSVQALPQSNTGPKAESAFVTIEWGQAHPRVEFVDGHDHFSR